MRFAFTEDQELSRQSFRGLLERTCTGVDLRAAWNCDTGRIPGLWSELSHFGAVGLLAPQEAGGTGLTDIDLALLLEEAGRAALPEPLLECAAVAVPLLVKFSTAPGVRSLLEGVASGDSFVAVALEPEPYVVAADGAKAIILQRGDEAHIVPREACSLERQNSVDGARRMFRVTATCDASTLVAQGAAATAAFAEARNRAALGTGALLVGLGARLIEITIEYAKTRRQFGQAIGAFQAVKHQIAEAFMGLSFARPLVYRAAHSMTLGDSDRSVHVSAAKAFASDAATRAARVALQVHGAIGYSYEHDLHLWMKRVWALAPAWGDAATHRARIASHLLGES